MKSLMLIHVLVLLFIMSKGQSVPNGNPSSEPVQTPEAVIQPKATENSGNMNAQTFDLHFRSSNLVALHQQKRSKNTLYSDQCEQYRKLKNAGGWTILGGGVVSTIGVAMIFNGLGSTEGMAKNGIQTLIAGDVIQVIGTVIAIVGKANYRHSCALHMTATGTSVGLAYNF